MRGRKGAKTHLVGDGKLLRENLGKALDALGALDKVAVELAGHLHESRLDHLRAREGLEVSPLWLSLREVRSKLARYVRAKRRRESGGQRHARLQGASVKMRDGDSEG